MMSSSSGDEPAIQEMEEFWGVELTKEKKTVKWDAEDDDDEEEDLITLRTLELRQACLGPGAKEGERNIVQVTVDDGSGSTSTFSILSLKVGLAEQAALSLNLQPPVILKLVEGSGPVDIVGHTKESMEGLYDSNDEDSDEDELSEELMQVGAQKKLSGLPQKRPATSTSVKPPAAKVAKKEPEPMEADDDDEDDDEDEEDDDEDDEDEDDEEEDEDDSEEEEEERPKPPIVSKKPQINGTKQKTPMKDVKDKATKVTASKTPQPQQQKAKFQQKVSASVPSKSVEKKRPAEKKTWKQKNQQKSQGQKFAA